MLQISVSSSAKDCDLDSISSDLSKAYQQIYSRLGEFSSMPHRFEAKIILDKKRNVYAADVCVRYWDFVGNECSDSGIFDLNSDGLSRLSDCYGNIKSRFRENLIRHKDKLEFAIEKTEKLLNED